MNVKGLWYFSHWKPSLYFSKKSFKELFGFGSKLLAC
ncbi:MAG: oligosaccharide flippase family protein, partial [Flavobacteriaceae bacterium]|nr:oligosaccharide flippase family protein [Flavobacteriaceae bacterium]